MTAVVISGPHAATATVTYCDPGQHRMRDRSWWLVRDAGQEWEGGRGAVCSEHVRITSSEQARSLRRNLAMYDVPDGA